MDKYPIYGTLILDPPFMGYLSLIMTIKIISTPYTVHLWISTPYTGYL